MAQNNITENLNAWNKLDRYSKWIYHMYEKYIGKEVLDIGGGVGTAISFYIDKAERVVATELFENQVNIMNKRFENYQYFKAIQADIMKDDFSAYDKFDTIILINVLEHIEDDRKALANMKKLLKDSGTIIICVPAMPGLYCYMDKNVGHYRRYARGELSQKAKENGLQVIENTYMNFMGIFPYWFKGKFGKDTGGSFSTSIEQGESKLYSVATTILEPIERLFKPHCGISEFIILKK